MVENSPYTLYLGQVEDGRILIYNYDLGQHYLIGAGYPDERVNRADWDLATCAAPKGETYSAELEDIQESITREIFRVRHLHVLQNWPKRSERCRNAYKILLIKRGDK